MIDKIKMKIQKWYTSLGKKTKNAWYYFLKPLFIILTFIEKSKKLYWKK